MKKLNLLVLLAGGLYSTYGMADVDCAAPVPVGDTLIYCDDFEGTTLNFNNPNYADFSGGVDFANKYLGRMGSAIGVDSIKVGGSRNATGSTSSGVDGILLNNGIYGIAPSSSVTTGSYAVGFWGASGGVSRAGETIAIRFSVKDASGETYSSINVGLDVASAFLADSYGTPSLKYPEWSAFGSIDVALFAGTKDPSGGGLPDDSDAIATGQITSGKLNTAQAIWFDRDEVDLDIDPTKLGSATTVTLMLSVNAKDTGITTGTVDLPNDPSIYGTRIKAYALIDNLKIVGLQSVAIAAPQGTVAIPTTSLLSLLGLVGLLAFVIRRQVKNKDVS